MPHPELGKAQLDQHILGGFDLTQQLRRDRRPMRHARRQTGHRRFIPHRQPQVLGNRPHLGLGDADLHQRRPYPVLARRLHAGPEIAYIAGIVPVHHRLPTLARRNRRQLVVQLGLAKIAPVHRVGRIVGVEMLLGVHLAIRHAHALRQLDRLAHLARRIAGRHADTRQCPVAQLLVGHGHHQRAVHATRIGHQHRPTLSQQTPQRFQFGGDLRGQPVAVPVHHAHVETHPSSIPSRATSGLPATLVNRLNLALGGP